MDKLFRIWGMTLGSSFEAWEPGSGRRVLELRLCRVVDGYCYWPIANEASLCIACKTAEVSGQLSTTTHSGNGRLLVAQTSSDWTDVIK